MAESCKDAVQAIPAKPAQARARLPLYRRSARFSLVAVALLITSAAMLVKGQSVTYDVRVMDAEELVEILGIEPFETIGDHQLVIDTTFTGVVHRGDRLYSTYDRSAPPQKRACPT